MEKINAARVELTAFLQESGKSQSKIAKETGLSSAVISQFLGGNYPGDNAEIATTIAKYLTVSKQRLNAVQATQFYPELHNTKEVLFACNYAHRRNGIVLVSGDAGAGKTTALRYYAENNTGVIIVTANACTKSATAALQLICEKLGKRAPCRKAALMQLLVEQLTDSNRLIIVDEADHLTLDALQAVRNLNDLAGVGIVFSGNDKIYLQMTATRKGYEFDQLRTRMIVRKRVTNEYFPEELAEMFPNSSTEMISFLLKLAGVESLRTAKKVFEIAHEAATEVHTTLDYQLLKKTQRELMGAII